MFFPLYNFPVSFDLICADSRRSIRRNVGDAKSRASRQLRHGDESGNEAPYRTLNVLDALVRKDDDSFLYDADGFVLYSPAMETPADLLEASISI